MYVVELIPSLAGDEARDVNLSTLSSNTTWVLFDTMKLCTHQVKMSSITAGVCIGLGKFDNSLMFVYAGNVLRLVSKMTVTPTDDGKVYGITVGPTYDAMEVHKAMIVFCDTHEYFIARYHSTV